MEIFINIILTFDILTIMLLVFAKMLDTADTPDWFMILVVICYLILLSEIPFLLIYLIWTN